jgi:hypothetical protein
MVRMTETISHGDRTPEADNDGPTGAGVRDRSGEADGITPVEPRRQDGLVKGTRRALVFAGISAGRSDC